MISSRRRSSHSARTGRCTLVVVVAVGILFLPRNLRHSSAAGRAARGGRREGTAAVIRARGKNRRSVPPIAYSRQHRRKPEGRCDACVHDGPATRSAPRRGGGAGGRGRGL